MQDEENNANYVNEEGNTSYVDKEETSNSMVLVCNVEEERNNNTWFLDICSSNHMCVKEMFIELDEMVNSMTKFGNDRKFPIKGRGKILIRACNGDQVFISNVLFLPGLESILLSISQLMEISEILDTSIQGNIVINGCEQNYFSSYKFLELKDP